MTTMSTDKLDPAAQQPDPVEAAAPAEPVDAIDTLRAQIDTLDAAIIRLVAERTRVSQRVQAARISAGGTRIQLGRERTILDGYRAGLGPDGPQLASAVLRIGRGAL